MTEDDVKKAQNLATFAVNYEGNLAEGFYWERLWKEIAQALTQKGIDTRKDQKLVDAEIVAKGCPDMADITHCLRCHEHIKEAILKQSPEARKP